jgi:hypothetical protein
VSSHHPQRPRTNRFLLSPGLCPPTLPPDRCRGATSAQPATESTTNQAAARSANETRPAAPMETAAAKSGAPGNGADCASSSTDATEPALSAAAATGYRSTTASRSPTAEPTTYPTSSCAATRTTHMPLHGHRTPRNAGKPAFLESRTGTPTPGDCEKNPTNLVEKGLRIPGP